MTFDYGFIRCFKTDFYIRSIYRCVVFTNLVAPKCMLPLNQILGVLHK
jgi:hypothetical protein